MSAPCACQLNRSYNPIWFTNNELSQITPLPLAWDRTSSGHRAGTTAVPDRDSDTDVSPAGAKAVYRFLNAQAKNLSGYATSPIWSIVDGPWKLQPADRERAGDVRPQPEVRRPRQAASGEVRRAPVHQ